MKIFNGPFIAERAMVIWLAGFACPSMILQTRFRRICGLQTPPLSRRKASNLRMSRFVRYGPCACTGPKANTRIQVRKPTFWMRSLLVPPLHQVGFGRLSKAVALDLAVFGGCISRRPFDFGVLSPAFTKPAPAFVFCASPVPPLLVAPALPARPLLAQVL